MQTSKNLDVITNSGNISLESISKLANSMASEMEIAIKKIQDINEETHILALNAAIEASSAGDSGKGFGVVAEHMGSLSNETAFITKNMSQQSQNRIVELGEILTTQATNVRGDRLANLALSNIDLIDRNLYERAADVRWWAKDQSVVEAISCKNQGSINKASKRLNMILKYYTIYHDLIITDLQGNVLANGNPRFKLVGRNISSRLWFKAALSTRNGDEFGFDTVHRSQPIDNQMIVTFSCKIHQNGNPNLPEIGVFASLFNWSGFAQKIIDGTPVNEEDKEHTRICILDNDGTILADSENKLLEKLEFKTREELFSKSKNFEIRQDSDQKLCYGHAISPGFEGYSTGWHSLIIQELKTIQ